MSGWGLRGWNPGRWSPFGRQGEPAVKVTDADYSYITAEDLDQHRAETRRNRPSKDTDVIIFRINKVSHPVHFAAYAIDDGDLTVGAARELAAKRLEVRDPRSIRMFYKGKNLKEDAQHVRDFGMRSDNTPEVLCVVGDPPPDDSGSDSDGSASDVQNRSSPAGVHPLHKSSAPASASNRAPSPGVQTAHQKLQALSDKLQGELVPLAEDYINNPPSDKAKRDFEYKRLSETILAQVLLKTDAVETEGNEDARQMRKAVVREAQGWLNKLDEVQR
ncbi:hypothetical protein FH972_022783 [Carpinus fangiana]|uniref:BAG domain-containing protein n=1 Tax=Carpinus fangiana TaxID=176857 RepID=A0A5N6KVG8_9ROSI|nr:hypothetical protein FH972_022783 [Carpinus fangiana]